MAIEQQVEKSSAGVKLAAALQLCLNQMHTRVSELEAHNRALKLRQNLFPKQKPTPAKLAKAIKIQVAAEMAKIHEVAD